MKEKVNAEEAAVVEEVNDIVSTGIGLVVISMVKGEKPKDDKLNSTIYFRKPGKFFKDFKTIEGRDLTSIINESVDVLTNEGVFKEDIEVTYSHQLVSEIINQEVKLSESKMIKELKSMKSSYESMSSNSIIELSNEQKGMIEVGIKITNKLLDKFEPKTEGGE